MTEMCCTWLAENTGRKTGQKIAIWAPSHKFVGLCLCNYSRYRQSVSRLGFVTAATSLTGVQPNFARCLADSWLGTLYIQLQNSLCVQVLCYPLLAALLHGSRAAGVSHTLWRGTRNRITDLSQRVPPRVASVG